MPRLCRRFEVDGDRQKLQLVKDLLAIFAGNSFPAFRREQGLADLQRPVSRNDCAIDSNDDEGLAISRSPFVGKEGSHRRGAIENEGGHLKLTPFVPVAFPLLPIERTEIHFFP